MTRTNLIFRLEEVTRLLQAKANTMENRADARFLSNSAMDLIEIVDGIRVSDLLTAAERREAA